VRLCGVACVALCCACSIHASSPTSSQLTMRYIDPHANIFWFLVFFCVILISTNSLIPNVLWAQRSGTLYVTIDVQDVTNEKTSIEEGKVHFSGKSGAKDYAVSLELLHEIDPAVCSTLATL
jgi:CS domain